MPIRRLASPAAVGVILSALLCTACAERDQSDGASSINPVIPEEKIAPTAIPVSFTLSNPVQSCNIETVNGESADGRDVHVAEGAVIAVAGWALPPDDSGAADAPFEWGLFLQLQDGRLFDVGDLRRVARPDLSTLAPGTLSPAAGFIAEFLPPEGATGRIGLFLAPRLGDIRLHCALGRGVEVVPR